MAKKEILVCYDIDIDAVAGWLGSYNGEDSPDDISRGMFAGEVGIPRLLDLFAKYGLKTSWSAPGHSIETFPEQMKMIVDAGHEIVLHGYSHENPIAMTPRQEEEVLVKCIGLIEDLTGKKPVGYTAPWWEFSHVTNELLDKYHIQLPKLGVVRCKFPRKPKGRILHATITMNASGEFRISVQCETVLSQTDEKTGVVEIRSLLWAWRKTPPKEGEEKGSYAFAIPPSGLDDKEAEDSQ